MLHIILLILKIIGIILLCILGILLLAVVCVLFVPVRYQIKADRDEGEEKPPFTACVKVTWLLHLVNILVRYPADVIVRVRIAVFTLFRIPRKEKKGGKKIEEPEKESETEKKEKKMETPAKESQPEENYEAFDSGFAEMESPTDSGQTPEHSEAQEAEPTGQEQDTAADKISLSGKIRGIIDKIKQIIEKIKSLFENIQYTIRELCDKIKSVLDNIEYYREVFESEPFTQSWQLCREELKSVFKSLKPDKFEADFIVGMDDPAATGQILAIYGILYPLVGQNIQVVGDFERTHVEGNLYIRGKIRVFTFLKAAIRIYFNKDVKKLIKLLKKEAV
ncbi:MAG: hypothetical protein NC416_08975 [Eubacterium sp.]|nr:hypothetical protein [Eubacterium sp.]